MKRRTATVCFVLSFLLAGFCATAAYFAGMKAGSKNGWAAGGSLARSNLDGEKELILALESCLNSDGDESEVREVMVSRLKIYLSARGMLAGQPFGQKYEQWSQDKATIAEAIERLRANKAILTYTKGEVSATANLPEGTFPTARLSTAPRQMVGKQLPDLHLEYLRSAPYTNGKPLIVEFWATWCGPCIMSIPHLNKLYSELKDDIPIISVTRENTDVVKAFLKTNRMDYFLALDPEGAFGRQFGFTGIPHAVVVDKGGKIVWEGHPMELNRELALILLETEKAEPGAQPNAVSVHRDL